MRPGRHLFLVLACLSVGTLAFSGWNLAQRIAFYNKTEGRQIYYFFPVNTTLFTFAGKAIEVTDQLDDEGKGDVIVRYGDDTLAIPVTIPNELPLPGLSRHTSWLRFHVFAAAEENQTFDEFQAALERGEANERLVAVVRTPFAEPAEDGLFGLETEEDWGWGEVRRDRWAFTFHEFLPEGGWQTETLRFPESGKAFYRRQVAAEKAGLPPPTRREGELEEGSWQYDAAIPLMNRPPAITNEQQALRNAGWTLPVASASVVVFMLSIAFAFAPSRGKGNPSQGPRPESPASTKAD